MRLQKKSLSKVTLISLLRRRKNSFKTFLEQNGIVTYERLISRCSSLGVVSPTEEQFNNELGVGLRTTSSPTDGIVVVVIEPEPDPVYDSNTVLVLPSVISAELSAEDSNTDTVQRTSKKKKSIATSAPPEIK